MTAQTKAVNKSRFETGDIPTQAQFEDLIDSYDDAGTSAAHNASATAHGLTANISAALSGAASPSGANVFATLADVPETDEANIWTAIQTFGASGSANGITKYYSTLANDAPFDIALGVYSFYGGTQETTLSIGYNLLDEKANTHQISIGLESNYRATATEYYSEWYVAYNNAARTKNVRPFQCSIDNNTYHSTNFYSAEYHYFCGSDGLSENFLTMINGATPVILLGGSTELQHGTNNAVMIRQKATTGTQVALLYLTNLNTLSLSSGGYLIAPMEDIDFHYGAYTKGVVLYDASNGHAYRIKVTGGGNLTTEYVR